MVHELFLQIDVITGNFDESKAVYGAYSTRIISVAYRQISSKGGLKWRKSVFFEEKRGGGAKAPHLMGMAYPWKVASELRASCRARFVRLW